MPTKLSQLVLAFCGVLVLPISASALPFRLPAAAFVGAPVIDLWTGQPFAPDGRVTIDGVTFGFTFEPWRLPPLVSAGLGNTPNLTAITGSISGELSIVFPAPVQALGYGYALSRSALPDALTLDAITIQLFDAFDNSLGLLSFNEIPDPVYITAFAGVGNDIPFTRANVTFALSGPPSSEITGRFALNNLVYQRVPEPSTLLLVSTGLASILLKKTVARRLSKGRRSP